MTIERDRIIRKENKPPLDFKLLRAVKGFPAVLPSVCVGINMKKNEIRFPISQAEQLGACANVYEELRVMAGDERTVTACGVMRDYYILCRELVSAGTSPAEIYKKTVAHFRKNHLFSANQVSAEEYISQCLKDVGIEIDQKTITDYVCQNQLHKFHHRLLARIFPPGIELMDRNEPQYSAIREIVDEEYRKIKIELFADPQTGRSFLVGTLHDEMDRVVNGIRRERGPKKIIGRRILTAALGFGKGEEFVKLHRIDTSSIALDLRPTDSSIEVIKGTLSRNLKDFQIPEIINGEEVSFADFVQKSSQAGNPSIWVRGGIDFDNTDIREIIPEQGVDAVFSCYGVHHAADLLKWLDLMSYLGRYCSIIDGRPDQEHWFEQIWLLICQAGALITGGDSTITHARTLPKEVWQLIIDNFLESFPWEVSEVDPTKDIPLVLKAIGKVPKFNPRKAQLRIINLQI